VTAKLFMSAALTAALATLTPALAQAQGPQGAPTDALSRMRENIRLSAESDFYNRVANVDERSAGAGLFALPASRSVPPMMVASSPKGSTFSLPGMDHAMKAMKSQPFMVTPWFIDCFNGIGVTLRGRLF